MNYLMRLSLLALIFIISAGNISAQLDNLKIGVYADTYIRTDNDRAGLTDPEPPFSYGTERGFNVSNPLESTFGLNIAQISFMTATDTYRGNVTFHYGDIPRRAGWSNMYIDDDNVAFELLQYVQQAWVGVQLVDNLWLDGGFFLSHIGTENLLPANNFFANHSVMAVAEPFQQAGMRLSYIFTDNFSGTLYIVNSINNFYETNHNKTAGLSLIFMNDEKNLSVAYNGGYGNEQPGSPNAAKFTMLHNIVFYAMLQEMIELKIGFDYFSTDEIVRVSDGEFETGTFLGASASGRFHVHEQFKAALRLAYFDNSDGAAFGMLPAVPGLDITLGGEYNPTANSYIRLEGRMLMINDREDSEGSGEVFFDGDDQVNTRMGVSLNFGVWFNQP